MDIIGVLNILLPVVFILVGVALIVFVVELIKTLRVAQGTINKLGPTLKNVENITTNIQPTLAKVDPLMDRVQLTVDSVNLEMMRVDKILEDVTVITDAASAATTAVDNIANAPLKAVNNVANRVKSVFSGKGASEESAQLAEQRVAVAQALEDYKATEKKDAEKTEHVKNESVSQKENEVVESSAPKSYVQVEEGAELVIDPEVIAESPFFNESADAE